MEITSTRFNRIVEQGKSRMNKLSRASRKSVKWGVAAYVSQIPLLSANGVLSCAGVKYIMQIAQAADIHQRRDELTLEFLCAAALDVRSLDKASFSAGESRHNIPANTHKGCNARKAVGRTRARFPARFHMDAIA